MSDLKCRVFGICASTYNASLTLAAADLYRLERVACTTTTRKQFNLQLGIRKPLLPVLPAVVQLPVAFRYTAD
jgi:hypothetical protein